MSREPRRLARAKRWPATLPPSRPFIPHMRRFVPGPEFARMWFMEFAELLNPRHPSSVRLVDMEDKELCFPLERRAQIEKKACGSKANYFIKECITDERYFVKQSLNLDRLKREWLASQKFREHRIPSVHTASYWFECLDEKSETQNSGFIVFPFLNCWTLRELYSNDSLALQMSEQDWLLGLVSITEVFALTDPDNSDSQLHFYHCDLHSEQIVFDWKKRRWFLIDFGNAKLSFEERIGSAPPRWVELDVIPGSSYTAPADQEFARLRGLFKPGLRTLWRQIEDACKTNTRHEALTALKQLYEQLYGALPDLHPAEDEQPEFNVVGGVSRLTAAPGLSYVEAAQLERQRAQERARRNNRGFMQQVQMILNGAIDSPRRSTARSPASKVPTSPKRPRTPAAKSRLNLALEENEIAASSLPRPLVIQPTDNEEDDVDIDSAPAISVASSFDIPTAQVAIPLSSVAILDQGRSPEQPILIDDNTDSLSSHAVAAPPSVSAPTVAPMRAQSSCSLPTLQHAARPESSPPKHPIRDPSPEIAPVVIIDESTHQSSSAIFQAARHVREASPARSQDLPPASPSISLHVTVKSPKRSQLQRLEEEAEMWARRQERRAAAAARDAQEAEAKPQASVSPPKAKQKRDVSEAEQLAQEALAWQRRLERRMAEQQHS